MDAAACRGSHSSPKLAAAAIEHGNIVTLAQPHHPGEMIRFVLGQRTLGHRGIEERKVKTRQRHARIMVQVALYSRASEEHKNSPSLEAPLQSQHTSAINSDDQSENHRRTSTIKSSVENRQSAMQSATDTLNH
jgi:hypothetical protein